MARDLGVDMRPYMKSMSLLIHAQYEPLRLKKCSMMHVNMHISHGRNRDTNH